MAALDSGKCIIVSAPSGAGKTTIVRHLLARDLELDFSISATSRSKRDYERDGYDYFFLTEEDFRKRIAEDAFVEWEEVYPGRFYGTLRSEIERIWEAGHHPIFDVDVVGGV
ncbi:MAG: guanylate kinase, partial [Flavobacteriales bacterium]